jgi:hypothetical protein
VTILGTPQDGQVLVFNGLTSAGGPRWQNDFFARLNFILLTTGDDVLRIFREARGNASAGISLQNLPTGAAYTYRLPALPANVTDVTFAINNLFTVTNVDGTAVDVPSGAFGEAFADCPAGSKAIGVGVSAFPPVTLQDTRIVSSTQVRVRAWRSVSQTTAMNAVAYCMSMP